MKRVLLLILAALMIGLLSGCGSTPATTTTAPPAATTPAPTEPGETDLPLLSADGVLSCTRDGDSVAVTVTLPDAADKEVSLIALTDAAYRLNWWENHHARLSDLGQLKLDNAGKGTLTLQLKENTASFCLILTAPCGAYLLEVN